MASDSFLFRKKTPSHRRAWPTILCGSFFYCYQFIIRVSPNVMADDIMGNLLIDSVSFGVIVGFYYWAYSGIQIPLGLIMDKFGPRLFLSSAGFICGLACIIFASTHNVFIASCARFLMGLGAASGFLGTLKLGTLWLPPQKLSKVIAVTLVLGTIGATLGGAPLSYVSTLIGWREALIFLGFVGFIQGTVTFILVRNQPPGALPATSQKGSGSLFSGIIRVISSPQAWIISGVGMLMYVPLTLMGDAWGVPYVRSVYNLDEKLAATCVTAMFVGAMVGSPFFTALSDRLMSRCKVLYIGGTANLIVYCTILFYTNLPLPLIYVLFFAGGFFYTAKALCFASISEVMPRSINAQTIGFTNAIVMFSGVFFHPLVGKIMSLTWDGVVDKNGAQVYTASDYQAGLMVVPISLAISLLLVAFMRETHPARRSSSYK